MEKRRNRSSSVRQSVQGRKSTRSLRGSLLRSLDSVLEQASRTSQTIRQAVESWSKPQAANRYALQALEPRLLLSATLTAGEFTLFDQTASSPNNGAVVMVGAGATGVTSVTVNTTNNGVSAGNDSVDSIVVALDASGSYNVQLSFANIVGSTPNITFTGGKAGAPITLGVYDENITDASGSGFGQLTGSVSGYTATTFVADTNATIAPGGMTDDTTVAAGGNIGNVDLTGGSPSTLGGGAITLRNIGATGNVGTLTLPAVDLTQTGATGLTISSRATGAATTDGGVSAGNFTLGGAGNYGATITTEANTTVADPGANITLGAVTMGAGNDIGFLTINTTSDTSLGNVTLGDVTTQGSGGAELLVEPAGTADIGQVSLGVVSISGSAGTNGVVIGSGTTTFTAGSGVTATSITNTSTGGSDFSIAATAIPGAISLGNYSDSDPGVATDGDIFINVGGNVGGPVTFGDVTLGDAGDVDAGGLNIFIDGTAAGFSFGNVTLDSTSSSDSVTVEVEGASAGNLSVGNITATGAGTAQRGDFSFTSDGTIGNVTFGNVTIGDNGDADTSDISVQADGNIGNVTFGTVDLNGFGGSDKINVNTSGTNTLGAVTFTGDVTDATNRDINIGTAGTGGVVGAIVFEGNVTLSNSGNVQIDDGAGAGAIDHVTITGSTTLSGSGSLDIGNAAAATMGAITLNAVTLSSSGDLNIAATSLQGDAIAISGQWVFSGSGSVSINANGATSSIGNVGGSDWDIDYGADGVAPSAGAGLYINTSDGVGNLTIDSVDYVNPADGVIQIDANSDAASEDGTTGFTSVGSMGNVTILNDGDNSVGVTGPVGSNAWNNVEWGAGSWISALSIGNITIAGGAEGKFIASVLPNGYVGTPNTNGASTVNVGGSGTIGVVTLGGQSNGLTLVADDGITSVTINAPDLAAQVIEAAINALNTPQNAATLVSTATGVTIVGDNDISDEIGSGNVAGNVGPITSAGASGFTALSGNVSGVNVGNVSLAAGDLDLNITARAGQVAADRVTLNNADTAGTIGNVTVSLGNILGGSYIADTGIGNIAAQGDITLTTLDSNAIAIAAIPGSINNPIGTITAGGSITINTEETTSVADEGNAALATQNIGNITAGNAISINNLIVGGSINTIQVVRINTSGTGSVSLPNMVVNGNVNLIESGLTTLDSITVNGTIYGDLNNIDAGDGVFSTSDGGLNVVTATRSASSSASAAPLFVITQGDGETVGSATDYILSLSGTWTAVTDPTTIAPSMNVTVSFYDGGGIDSANNTVTINDLTGDTSAANSVLALATRANVGGAIVDYTSTGLGVKTVAAKYNLGGFTDTYSALDPTGTTGKGRNNFNEILIEGNLDGGIGNPGLSTSIYSANAMVASNAPILGNVGNIDIAGNWDNPATDDNSNPANRIFVVSLGEISVGSVTNNKAVDGLVSPFSYEAVDAASTPTNPAYHGVAAGINRDGVWEDLEIFTALSAITSSNVSVSVLPGTHVHEAFVGPDNTFEFIEFTNNDPTVVGTFVMTFDPGYIDSIYLYGQQLGVEYQAYDASNPATVDPNNGHDTNIFYGVTNAGNTATSVTGDVNAIDFLEFSSSIGNIDVVDANTSDAFAANVGSILVGYNVIENGASDLQSINSYIDNPNRSGVGQTAVVTNPTITGSAAVIVTGSIGAITVDGSITGSQSGSAVDFIQGGIVSSGGVGSVTTIDTTATANSANLSGLVTDGSSGAITVNGSVLHSLVVGDATVTGLGADGLLDTADDTLGASGSFTGDITVTGNLGTTARWVEPYVEFTRPGGQIIQAPFNFDDDYTSTYTDAAETMPSLTGELDNLSDGYNHDEVSAPAGLSANITVGGNIETAIISGKGILVNQAQDQTNSNITGNIIAGLTGATATGGDINGDIWSGESIGGSGTVIEAYSLDANGAYVSGGNISSAGQNDSVLIDATGTAGTGNITSNIIAYADITDIHIYVGNDSEPGTPAYTGSFLGNIVAGQDPLFDVGTGGGITTNRSDNELEADNDIGINGTSYITSAGSQTWDYVEAGYEVGVGGNINSDFLAGVPIGGTQPFQADVNDSNLPIFQNVDSSISIEFIQTYNGESLNTGNLSNLNGTLVAAGSITVESFEIDGNAVGNDGVPGGHIAAAGMGYKDASFDSPNQLSIGGGEGNVTGILYGTFSSGMFVPAATANNSPLNANDQGPMAAGTVLTLGSADIDLTVGQWQQAATGNGTTGVTLGDLLTGATLGADASYAPVFSIGATEDISADIYVLGQPIVGTQTGSSNEASNLGGVASDGIATDVSIAAFGSISGSVTATNSASFNLVMSNIDAVIARGSSNSNPTTPSNASFFLPLNSGSTGDTTGDNGLSISTLGYGVGGLTVDFDTAGYDYFNDIATGSFYGSFGYGSLTGNLDAEDVTPADGLSVGNLAFAFVGAGQNITGNLTASGDIITSEYSAATDGNASPFPNSHDADAVAGLSASDIFNPTGGAGLFPGGNYSGKVVAGGEIGSASHFLSIGVEGDTIDATGNFTNTFDLVSGAADQLQAPGASVDIHALVIASGNIGSVGAGIGGGFIDAGDTQQAFAGYINTVDGSPPASGVNAGSFIGTIWAGAGNDLNEFTEADNQVNATIGVDILTAGYLDVRNPDTGSPALSDGGIYSEANINGSIEVGFGPDFGTAGQPGVGPGEAALLGNIVAEGNIQEIEVWGDLGSATSHGDIYAGGIVIALGVGDASGIPTSGDFKRLLRPASEYVNSFGNVYDTVFMAGQAEVGSTTEHTDDFTDAIFDPSDDVLYSETSAFADFATGDQIQITSGDDAILGTYTITDWINADNVELSVDITTDDIPAGNFAGNLVTVVPAPTAPAIFIGGAVIPPGSIIAGGSTGVSSFTYNSNGQVTTYTFDGGMGIFTIGANGVDVYAYNPDTTPSDGNGGLPINLTVTGPAGIDKFVAVDGVDSLNVLGGSVNQIIISDNYNVMADITAAEGALADPITLFPFLADSLTSSSSSGIGLAVGNDKVAIDANVINVQGNIGTTTALNGQSGATIGTSLTGLTAADNVAILVQGNLLGSVTSEQGSIGNVVVMGQDTIDNSYDDDSDTLPPYNVIGIGEASFVAQNNIGDIYAGLGSFGFTDTSFIEARTGSIGILSVRDDINLDNNYPNALAASGDEDSATNDIDVAQNVGGLVARTGSIGDLTPGDESDFDGNLLANDTNISDFDGDNDTGLLVHGSIGLIQASGDIGGYFTAETGSIGIDLRTSETYVTAYVDPATSAAGVYSDVGNIQVAFTAGTDIGNVTAATGSIEGDVNSFANDFNGTVINVVYSPGGPGGNGGTITTGDSNGSVGDSSTGTGGDTGGNTANGAASDPIVNVTGSGNVLIVPTSVDSQFKAGGNIGNITAFDDFGNYTVTAGGNIGNITAITGSVGAGTGNTVDVFLENVQPDFGDPISVNTGALQITAVGTIGNIKAGGSIGSPDQASFVLDGITFNVPGSKVSVTSTTGSVGNVEAQTGNVGSALAPFTVVANGGVTINPNTLQETFTGGVGNVYSDLGSINANITTGGNVGTVVSGQVRGGIAAPAGTVNVDVHAGGSIGGVSGQVVNISPDSTGTMGVVTSNTGTTVGGAPTAVVTLTSGDYITVADPNVSGQFDTIYLGTGTAIVSFVRGGTVGGDVSAFIQSIDILGGNASNLLVFSDSTAYGDPTGYNVIAKGANPTDDKILAAQEGLVAAGKTSNGQKGAALINNLILSPGSVQVGDIDGSNAQGANVKTKLTNLIVEGSVADVNLGGNGSSLNNAVIMGNVSSVFATSGITGLKITGNAGSIQSGTAMSNVSVGGNASSISASTSIKNVSVHGNLGILSGGTINQVVVGGSVLQVSGNTVNNVSIVGSVGASTAANSETLNLGSTFGIDLVAQLLGTTPSNLSSIGNPGPNGASFYGGIFAQNATNVAVGGAISDLTIVRHAANNGTILFTQTLDDATVNVGGKLKVLTKVNGVVQ